MEGSAAAAPAAGPPLLTTAQIRALRPPRPPVSLAAAHGWRWEEERVPGGALVPTLTVFLAGGECRFTCLHCDLWRTTVPFATPVGALPKQLVAVLAAASPLPSGARIKLYNASNFFDERAVPASDEPALAALLAPFAEVVVECHPALVGERCFRFAERLKGRLQVALGLETVHPRALAALNKGMRVGDFARAAAALGARGVGVRAFVLVAAPGVPPRHASTWAARSAALAVAAGAEHVSLIPLRAGNGAIDALVASGRAALPTLTDLEAALDASLGLAPAVIAADLWDLERLAACRACFAARRQRLERINRSGRPAPPVRCAAGCEG